MCYGYYKRDAEEAATEAEEIEKETKSYRCVYYVQFAGGKQCYRYYVLILVTVESCRIITLIVALSILAIIDIFEYKFFKIPTDTAHM